MQIYHFVLKQLSGDLVSANLPPTFRQPSANLGPEYGKSVKIIEILKKIRKSSKYHENHNISSKSTAPRKVDRGGCLKVLHKKAP